MTVLMSLLYNLIHGYHCNADHIWISVRFVLPPPTEQYDTFRSSTLVPHCLGVGGVDCFLRSSATLVSTPSVAFRPVLHLAAPTSRWESR